jgi:dimethylglycine dehydrogenase
MEKGFLHWKADLLTEFDPFETGLDRFVKLDKPDFVGKASLLERAEQGPRKQLVSLEIDCRKAPAQPGASVLHKGEVVGTITSGDWGHRVGKNLAYAFVEPSLALPGSSLILDHFGAPVAAQVIAPSPYDAQHSLMRS